MLSIWSKILLCGKELTLLLEVMPWIAYVDAIDGAVLSLIYTVCHLVLIFDKN